MSTLPTVIIGAGPYGLAAAAHLRSANVEVRMFGRAMEFWQHQMPAGMFLRSSWEASHISDPHHALTLDAYQAAHSVQLSTPIPLDNFIAYGRWFQQQVVPDLDQRQVRRIEAMAKGFRLLMEDDDVLEAQRVIVATGIAPFAYRPAEFMSLPPQLASHSSDHSDLGCFAGRQVLVVGGGQSAIESAALLHEAGADSEVVLRASRLRWLRRSAWLHNHLRLVRQLLYPPTDVGPPGLNQVVASPDFFKRLPFTLQQRIACRSIRPAAADWLWPRVQGIQITTERQVVSAIPENGRLCVNLDDGTKRSVDHALLATGYRVDIARYSFLSPELQRSLRCVDGYPQLSTGFESSVPGLHFLGAPAARSFGPLMRFVSGTEYAARALTRYFLGRNSNGTNGNGAHD